MKETENAELIDETSASEQNGEEIAEELEVAD